MAERDELAGLPGTLELGWWLLMRPVSLHWRLLGLGIRDPDAPAWQLWRDGPVTRAYLARLATLLLVATPIMAFGLALLLASLGLEIDFYGLALDGAFGVALGIAGAVSYIASYLRIPVYLIELPWQFVLRARPMLRWSPVLHHELSYLPLPFLTDQIVAIAPSDPALVRRLLDACTIAPGQRRAGRRALAQLRARELTALARQGAFQSLLDLRGEWLPGPETDDNTLAAFREVARYLRAAELTLLPGQRGDQLGAARDRLRGLDNALLGGKEPDPAIYRSAVDDWQQLVDRWLTETESEAARELPNPFHAGQPLEPEFGGTVFCGRETLIAELESILGDPTGGASIALIGPRRCGKTSLLRMLPLKLPDALVVFFDLQANPVESPAALVRALVREAGDQARHDRRLALPDLPDGAPMEALRDWLEQLEHLEQAGRILICIDEFERLEDLFPGNRQALLQFMGLIRATIQHRRRVRLLVAGAAPFEELDALWNDHFVNLREIAIGHLDRAITLDLLTRPVPDFPADAIPEPVAEAIWGRTLGQPYLTQLFGQLLVTRLNRAGRRKARVEDCTAVEPELLDQAGYYLRNIVQAAPEGPRRALDTLTGGGSIDLRSLDRSTRRYLHRRCLVNNDGTLGIPLLAAYLAHEGD